MGSHQPLITEVLVLFPSGLSNPMFGILTFTLIKSQFSGVTRKRFAATEQHQ